MTFDEIPMRMMKLGVDRAWLAQQCDYKAGTLAAILAPNGNRSHKTDKALRRIWEALDREETRQKNPVAPLELFQVVLRPSDEEFTNWNRLANADDLLVKDWCMKLLNQAAENILDGKISGLQIARVANDDARYRANASNNAHLHAAAGSPILSEVQDWDGADDTVLVKINGLSMVPLLHDGEVIEMKHKRASRTPHVAKGKIYLFAYDGGYTVKKYNTRAATQDEIEAGISYVSAKDKKPKVRVLESLNPEFPEIVLKDEAEWVAWLPAKGK